jgi:polar amino acid transport system substrate-binding protein
MSGGTDDNALRAAARAELAPTGALRAGINLSNFLLVTGRSASGEPEGVSPSMAAEVARRLGVPVRYVPYRSPGELADAAVADAWDIGLIGAEPARAAHIDFTDAYAEIEATYLVPPGSPIVSVDDVDRPGHHIAVPARAAFELWLTDHVRHATLHRTTGRDGAFSTFVEQKMHALAGLRASLADDAARLPGARVLDGAFTSVQQAIGAKKHKPAAMAFLRAFVRDAKDSGLVAQLIQRFGVDGRLSVARSAAR